jgi:hypothetical protein
MGILWFRRRPAHSARCSPGIGHSLSNRGQFTFASSWQLPASDLFVSRLVTAPRGELKLYAVSQHGIGRFDDATQRWNTIYVKSAPNRTPLALAAHPTPQHTLFLGTNQGVYMSEDRGAAGNHIKAGCLASLSRNSFSIRVICTRQPWDAVFEGASLACKLALGCAGLLLPLR